MPYLLVFLVFVLYPVGYGLWLARHPASYVKLFDDPIFFRTAINTVIFLVVAINIKMVIALCLSGFFVHDALVDQGAVGAVHPAVGGAVDPDHPVGALHAQPRVGRDQHAPSSRSPVCDGPNWLNDPTLALSFSMLMHIWKSLPFWTLILLAGRLAIPGEQYEAASVDGATQLAEVPLHHLAVDALAVPHVDRSCR